MTGRTPHADAPVGDHIVWGGHATVRIVLGGEAVLTDPVLRRRVMHLQRVVPLVDGLGAGLRRGADLAPAPRPSRPRLAAHAAGRRRAGDPGRGRGGARAAHAPAGDRARAGRVDDDRRHWRSGRPRPRTTAVARGAAGCGSPALGYVVDAPATVGLLRRRHRHLPGHGRTSPRGSTWRSCRSGAGDRRSGPGTWIPNGRPRR